MFCVVQNDSQCIARAASAEPQNLPALATLHSRTPPLQPSIYTVSECHSVGLGNTEAMTTMMLEHRSVGRSEAPPQIVRGRAVQSRDGN